MVQAPFVLIGVDEGCDPVCDSDIGAGRYPGLAGTSESDL